MNNNKIEILISIFIKETVSNKEEPRVISVELSNDKVKIENTEMFPRQFKLLNDIQSIMKEYINRNK